MHAYRVCHGKTLSDPNTHQKCSFVLFFRIEHVEYCVLYGKCRFHANTGLSKVTSALLILTIRNTPLPQSGQSLQQTASVQSPTGKSMSALVVLAVDVSALDEAGFQDRLHEKLRAGDNG